MLKELERVSKEGVLAVEDPNYRPRSNYDLLHYRHSALLHDSFALFQTHDSPQSYPHVGNHV